MRNFAAIVSKILEWVAKFLKEYSEGGTEWGRLRKTYKKHGGQFREDDVNIFGVRRSTPENPDEFNDTIGVAFDREVYTFVATNDPGTYYTKTKRLNKKGAAHLVEGWHSEKWLVGTHLKGKRSEIKPALVQHAGEVTVWRDDDEDFIRRDDLVETGWFGINFHHGWDKPLKKMGAASAGCQVIRTKEDFALFMEIVLSSPLYRADKKNFAFSYFLLKEEDYDY